MIYLSNAFSLSMLGSEDTKNGVYLYFEEVTPVFVKTWLEKNEWVSCVGHPDTARLLSGILGIEIPTNRVSVSLNHSDFIFVAQYAGPRLPEGATTLPEGAQIKFVKVGFFELGI